MKTKTNNPNKKIGTIESKMNKENIYIVATIRPWNIKIYKKKISHYPGNWHLIHRKEDLTIEIISKINPRYIFFPHWSYIVPKEILEMVECVCFHETDLPYGRGGSPIQNLIIMGYSETMISALRMVEELDAGPIYFKCPLSLAGTAEEIFIRASKIFAKMILKIITTEPKPIEQKGEPTFFRRRTPDQSEISKETMGINEIFNHIRMLEAQEYPKAFINRGNFRFEFSNPVLKKNRIEANVLITKILEKKK